MKQFGLILLASSLLSACTGNLQNLQNIGKESDPTRFYTLASTVTPVENAASPLVIGVGPVTVADYLDRSQIVIRKSATELELGEFDRWAGKTDREIQRVLTADLAAQLGSQKVVTHPWRSAVTPDYSVEVAVERFERDADGKVKLDASWQVFADDGRTPLSFHRTRLEKESAAGYDAVSAALSDLVGQLSQQISAQIPKR